VAPSTPAELAQLILFCTRYVFQTSRMNWVSFEHWTLRLGTFEFPMPILFLWAFFFVMLFSGKTMTGGKNRATRIYSRAEQPVHYWLCSLGWGGVALFATYFWNVVFK
jgi:hypothetical protein